MTQVLQMGEGTMNLRGKVKWFKRDHGFIMRPGQPDVFVHYTGLTKGLVPQTEGKEAKLYLDAFTDVLFDVAPGRDGKPRAVNVRVVGWKQ